MPSTWRWRSSGWCRIHGSSPGSAADDSMQRGGCIPGRARLDMQPGGCIWGRPTRTQYIKHLHVLAEAGLVHGAREGRRSRWELDPSRLDEARRALDVISAQWDRALDRLQDY